MNNVTVGTKVRCVWRGRLQEGRVAAQRDAGDVRYFDVKLDNGYLARFASDLVEAVSEEAVQVNEEQGNTEVSTSEVTDGDEPESPGNRHWLTGKLETKPAPTKGKKEK